MTDRSQGRKKSLFPAQTSVLSGATFDYVVSGVNYKITFANLLGELGATGTMQQEGNVTATPILDVQGSINGIRNLEDGPGIITAVSAENGVTVSHNFTVDATGVPIIEDPNITSPVIRSLVPGSGISISGSGDEIQISATGIPATTKTVIVTTISDFPAAVAGVITLANDTEYAVRNDISTSDRFVFGNNCVISGSDNIIIGLSYTGSGIMFTSLNSSWTIKNITINCTSGTFIDSDGTSVEILQVKNSVINAGTFGTIDDILGVHFDDDQFVITTSGLTFGGSNGVVLIESTLSTIAAGTLFDLGTATFNGFSVTDGFSTLNGSSVFLSGAASSANINSGGLGSIHNCRFFGTGTPLQTITEFDIRWGFFLNDDIFDTHQDCLLSLTNNVTATTIPAIDTPTLVAGTWVVEHTSHFTGDANGRCTYSGTKDIHVDITISLSSAPVSGSNKIIGHYVAKNGVEISNSEAKNNISSGDLSRTTVPWRTVLSPGDFIEAFIENETDAVDILVTDAVIRIS